MDIFTMLLFFPMLHCPVCMFFSMHTLLFNRQCNVTVDLPTRPTWPWSSGVGVTCGWSHLSKHIVAAAQMIPLWLCFRTKQQILLIKREAKNVSALCSVRLHQTNHTLRLLEMFKFCVSSYSVTPHSSKLTIRHLSNSGNRAVMQCPQQQCSSRARDGESHNNLTNAVSIHSHGAVGEPV